MGGTSIQTEGGIHTLRHPNSPFCFTVPSLVTTLRSEPRGHVGSALLSCHSRPFKPTSPSLLAVPSSLPAFFSHTTIPIHQTCPATEISTQKSYIDVFVIVVPSLYLPPPSPRTVVPLSDMEQASGDDVPRGRALPATDLPRPNPGPSETQHDLSITARPPSSQPAGDGASQDVVPAPLPNTSGPATSQPTAAAAPASQPGSNQFANDPARTHRKWSPRYGRVQKCDFCNGRSPGTLHVCDTCLLHICEGCARRGAWHTESKHFIDPDACDWTPKKQPRKRKDRGSKRRRDDSPSGASGASGPAQRRRLSGPSRGDDGDGVDADNEPHRPAPGQYHSRTSSPFPAAPHGAGRTTPLPPPLANQAQFPAPSSPAQVAGTARPFPDAGPPGTAEGDLRHHRRHRRPSQGPAPFITAASARPNVRQAAARALVGMSQQAYRAYRAQADDDDDDDDGSEENNGREEEEEEKGHAAARRSDQPPRRTAPGARTGGGGGSTRASTTPTTPGMRGSSRPSTPSAAAAEPDPLVVAGLPPGTPGGRDRLVVDLYRDIFGAPPDPSVSRVRTTIPDRWDGDWPAHPGREPGRPYGPYGPYGAPHAPPPSLHPPPPPPLSVHEQYHRELFTATTQFAQHVPPPPRGYGHYSFHNFPAVSLSLFLSLYLPRFSPLSPS